MFKIGDEVLVSPDDVDVIVSNVFPQLTRGGVVGFGVGRGVEVYLYRYKRSEIFSADQVQLHKGIAGLAGQQKVCVSVHCFTDAAGNTNVKFGVLDRAELGYCMGRLDDGSPFCSPESYVFIESEIDALPDFIEADIYKRARFRTWLQGTPKYSFLSKGLTNHIDLFQMQGGEYVNDAVNQQYRIWVRRESL